eukprot:2085821-Pyramimonas_sp.AAC.1
MPDLRPTQELIERPWPVQPSSDLLSWAPYWHSSSAQAVPGLIQYDPSLESTLLEIYTDVTAGGY